MSIRSMTYTEDYNIETLEDVQNFAKYLYCDRGVAFHPDDDFTEYENHETHEPTFTAQEASMFNRLMEQCFDVCERNGKDLYEVMIEFHPILNSIEKDNG